MHPVWRDEAVSDAMSPALFLECRNVKMQKFMFICTPLIRQQHHVSCIHTVEKFIAPAPAVLFLPVSDATRRWLVIRRSGSGEVPRYHRQRPRVSLLSQQRTLLCQCDCMNDPGGLLRLQICSSYGSCGAVLAWSQSRWRRCFCCGGSS